MDKSVQLSSPLRVQEGLHSRTEDAPVKKKRTNKGGWKIMPFIIGNEGCANLATASLSANLVVFLIQQYKLDQLEAAKISNIWGGIKDISPILGAIVADSYLGRFWTILVASFTYIMAMVLVTIMSADIERIRGTGYGLALLYIFLTLTVVGTGGVQSSSIAFGAEQFDSKDEEDRKNQQSFFNWYYCGATVSIMLGMTFVVYLQSNVSWKWGFGVATILMIISTVLFSLGTKYYVMVSPQGSAFTGYLQVIVASIRKRNLVLPSDSRELYDVPLDKEKVDLKLFSTDIFKFFNKAAIISREDYMEPGSMPNPWKLCPVQKIEELKSVIRILPIWSTVISVSIILGGSASTYMVYQAMIMNLNLGPHFKMPIASISAFVLLTISIWLPIYDKLIIPFFRSLTNRSEGITLIERIGTGIFISVITMVVAGLVEIKRKNSGKPISVFWLAPQYSLLGLAEAFCGVGMVEFLYVQFPTSMRSTAVALYWSGMGIGSFLSSVVITVVHNATGGNRRNARLNENLNDGRLEYFYWFFAGLGLLDFFYFLLCARLVRHSRSCSNDSDQQKENEQVSLSI
ncbi:protein NRT1/ PTR FAMILY 2.13 [Cryptomeria japonica]|uniref:protein NRT1/ PTR FAMILY 2.13 n=1 Tax=Cryptomeria japonica TaxID=3369 RepID=UPI0027DA2AD5|nr:protein NRT1/ PTR FAMILY 2.13 [Cryptomeria japonica]